VSGPRVQVFSESVLYSVQDRQRPAGLGNSHCRSNEPTAPFVTAIAVMGACVPGFAAVKPAVTA
jgi:hypothetical protein